MSDFMKEEIKVERLDYEENIQNENFNDKDIEVKLECEDFGMKEDAEVKLECDDVDIKEEFISKDEDFQNVTNSKGDTVVHDDVEIQQGSNKSIDCNVDIEETDERSSFIEWDAEMRSDKRLKKKELAAEKRNVMLTEGGPPSKKSTAGSSHFTLSADGLLKPEVVIHPASNEDDISQCQSDLAVETAAPTYKKKLIGQRSNRGFRKEVDFRVQRAKQAQEHDNEVNKLILRKLKIKVEIAEEEIVFQRKKRQMELEELDLLKKKREIELAELVLLKKKREVEFEIW